MAEHLMQATSGWDGNWSVSEGGSSRGGALTLIQSGPQVITGADKTGGHADKERYDSRTHKVDLAIDGAQPL